MIAPTAFAAEYIGRVVSIADGDTLTVLLSGNRQMKVRLAEIDTPEKGQPYGARSKRALSDLVFGEMVTVRSSGTDRYGRTIGRIYLGDLDVNAELVRSGAAWVYRKYARDRSLYAIENEARQNRVGLWALPEADRVPPWEWRSRARSGTTSNTTARNQSATAVYRCGAKRYCSEMATCREAYFHLQQCGLSRLDGNGDGVPCEAVCR
jgi:endonuclease YncB( thermonuclease family)